MITENMTLRQMIDCRPNDEELALLPLEVVVLCKLTVISLTKEENYQFLRYFFTQQETQKEFHELSKTKFFDFDAREIKNSHKFLTIAELYGKNKASIFMENLRVILAEYTGEADVILDVFTFDNKCYRLSLLEGVFKAEEVKDA